MLPVQDLVVTPVVAVGLGVAPAVEQVPGGPGALLGAMTQASLYPRLLSTIRSCTGSWSMALRWMKSGKIAPGGFRSTRPGRSLTTPKSGAAASKSWTKWSATRQVQATP